MTKFNSAYLIPMYGPCVQVHTFTLKVSISEQQSLVKNNIKFTCVNELFSYMI